jgi:hypothetical protein
MLLLKYALVSLLIENRAILFIMKKSTMLVQKNIKKIKKFFQDV